MGTSIGCKELGIVCDFVVEGKAVEPVVEELIRHVEKEHTDDWFEIEEFYQVARSLASAKVA
jgi:predicted small metal-binding protein